MQAPVPRPAGRPDASGWTCPFCPLLCDRGQVAHANGGPWRWSEPQAPTQVGCARADARLARHATSRRHEVPAALIDGQPVSRQDAVVEAARRLRRAGQVLVAGLGADVAAVRALQPVATTLGAIVDVAGGDAVAEGLRVLQDHGMYTATLAEVALHADVIVALGGMPDALAPRLAARLGLGDPEGQPRRLWIWGGQAPATDAIGPRIDVRRLEWPAGTDAFDAVQALATRLAGRRPARGRPDDAELDALAADLRGARYAVILGSAAALPRHAALILEGVNRIVGRLNEKTRAAALWIGGGEGAATAQQTLTWLTGLPQRSRVGSGGVDHEPLHWAGSRLLADGHADALLWLSLFDPDARPPVEAVALPQVVIGPASLAESSRRLGTVYLQALTPGFDSAGHLFRTDGTVVLPLTPLLEPALGATDAAGLLRELHAALQKEPS